MQLPRYHRLRHSFYRLEGSRCASCGSRQFPPRSVCRGCGSRELEPFTFCGRGKLYSYSYMRQTPRGFGSVGPYSVGMIELEEGPIVMAQLTDVDGVDLSIGMPVEMVTRKIREDAAHGYIVYGYKFRPRVAMAATERSSSGPGNGE